MTKKEIENVYRAVQKNGGYTLSDGCHISRYKRFYSFEYSLRIPNIGTVLVTNDWTHIAKLLKED